MQFFDMKKYYIAYGSNMSVSQMKERCPTAVPVGTAILKDWELVFRYHATIEPKPGASVPVVVWEITDSDERNLDHYEGYPHYYEKQHVTVEMREFKSPQKKKIMAMVYVMVKERSPISPPSGAYLNVIAEGYDRFKFNGGILRKAVDEAAFINMDSDDYAHYH